MSWLPLPIPRSWLLAVVLLVAVDWYVGRVFVPTHLAPSAAPANKVLRDHSGARNWGVLFRMAEERAIDERPRVAMVGDSTVITAMSKEYESLSPIVQASLRKQAGGLESVDVLEFAALGLPASDASILVAKALGLGSDLVVYAMTPRVLCEVLQSRTDASSWISEPDVARKLGPRYLMETFGLADLTRSFALAHSNLLRFRREIRTWVQRQRDVLPASLLALASPSGPPPGQFFPFQRTGPLWTHERCAIDFSNSQMQALRRIVEMCGESGRCLLYHGPVNPAALDLFESGLLQKFTVTVRDLAEQHGVEFRNYAFSIRIGGFIVQRTKEGAPVKDAIHLNADGRRRLASLIAADARRILARNSVPLSHEAMASVPRRPAGG